MNLQLNDPPRARNEGEQGFVSLEKLLHESDIVTLHVPLNRAGEDKTFHIISTSTFGMMKQGAWLINSSRGEVVDERALEVFLDKERLSGAILDVWENEPSVNSELLEKIAIATPHIAGYSLDGKQNATVQIVRALATFFHIPFLYWEPGKIHAPENQVISLDCQNQGLESTLCQAILHTCDVMQDDMRLRQNPASFEKLRGNYPVRREFPAYSVSLINDSQNAVKVLKELGFQVI
jgi:erythronate-4-phosphate dehydrogenase